MEDAAGKSTEKPSARQQVKPDFDTKPHHDLSGLAVEEKFSKAWCIRFWREQIRPLITLLLILFSVRSAIADWNVVPTGSMKPTIVEGDRIFVNKLAYDLKVPFTTWHLLEWSDPKRGEIVVFDSPRDGIRLVKRVVGVPGDTVQLIQNHLYVNRQPAVYQPLDADTIGQVSAVERLRFSLNFQTETVGNITHAMMELGNVDHRGYPSTFPAVIVPAGHYFMMGDNRDNSADSRFFMARNDQAPNPGWIGFVPRRNIVGRSSRVVISLNYDNYYLPRWNRTLRALP